MKNITQQEFERHIERIINGETTRKKLAVELETDIRTINYRITELAKLNPELYERFVSKFPYRAKTIENIDFEALIVEMILEKATLKEMAAKYDISTRTIDRKIKELEKTNPSIVKIYRKYSDAVKRAGKGALPDCSKSVKEIPQEEVKKSEINDVREQALTKVIEAFEILLESGMSKVEAARELGYKDHTAIWKFYKELERIQAQNDVIEKNANSRKSFRDSIKVTEQENSEGTGKIEINNQKQNLDFELGEE